jgi:hypothetical protein
MAEFYERTRIDLGDEPLQRGHVVYPVAAYHRSNGETQRIVYKENKNGDPQLSCFEAAFGELARIFMHPSLTPQQTLVKDANRQILGVASEFVGHTIANSAGFNKTYYKVQAQEEVHWTPMQVAYENDIPFYFLNHFPHGFFKKLWAAAKKNEIGFDMHSLVNVLGASYSLEEDDLHKGNFGFYVIEKDGKPYVIFFKIDHDLMLADSIMSRCQSRFLNWLNFSDAFAVTQRDLLNFPKIIDSKNYYWPTIKRFLRFNQEIAYNDDECAAFAELATLPEFCQHKWEVLYKHVLIPVEITEHGLRRHLDASDSAERAKISLIAQSVAARQAKMRAVLFSIPEFRQFVQGMDDEAKGRMVDNVTHALGKENPRITKEILLEIEQQQKLCESEFGFAEDDTPLHVAIRLGDYRYHETWEAFGHFAQEKNAQGKTALDVAAQLAQTSLQETAGDSRKNPLAILKHLLTRGVGETEYYKKSGLRRVVSKTDYLIHLQYMERVKSAKNYAEFRDIIRDLGEDHRFCLKMQKEITITCLRQFIDVHRSNSDLRPMLQQFKAELNGTCSTPPMPELQFIRQLRSQLWIVRIIRGLFGSTSTQAALNKILDKTIDQLTPKSSSRFFSFFCGQETDRTTSVEQNSTEVVGRAKQSMPPK